jgi:hypothetical protein
MSKSNPKIENPCSKFIDFKSDKGRFFFYDKEKEEQVDILLPIYFIVLDELATITGYNKKNDCGIYSNEVYSTAKEILRVKTFKGGESVIGLYNDIKDSIKAMGGKYTKSVYALFVHPDKTTELVNFKFKGASFSAWLEKKINPMKSIIGITGLTEETNGNTIYQVPVFAAFKLTPELDERAIHADEVLQDYLKEYFAQIPEKEIAKAETIEEHPEFVANDKWQGESRKQELIDRSKANNQDEDDLPF